MKKKLTINTSQSSLRSLFFSSFVICSLLIALLSCEQPFKAGLGPIIDLQDPTITLLSPPVKAYIRGVTEFTGRAADDCKLDSVWFNISNFPLPERATVYEETNYPLPSSTGYKSIKIGDSIFYRITNTTDLAGDSRTFSWKFTIDTTLLHEETGERIFPDGDFKLRLRAVDSVGKSVITDEIIFYIKNDIPEIVIDNPSIVQGTAYGELGGSLFNFDHRRQFPELWDTSKTPPQPPSFKRNMDTESLLYGRISDYKGIYREEEDPYAPLLDESGNQVLDEHGNALTVHVYPPQMRFWQVNLDPDFVSNPSEGIYKAGDIPPETYVPWVKIGTGGVGEFIGGDGQKDLVFSYVLPDKSGQYYAFQVRAQSTDIVHSKAVYPIDYFDNFDDRSENFKKENSYVLIRIVEPLEYPILTQYGLEDLYGEPWGGKPSRADTGSGVMLYNMLYEAPAGNTPEITLQQAEDGNHVYVDKPIVTKGGAFTLRMKASHTQDIASVKVYWEKDDKSEKGRFIWDWVDRPHFSWVGTVPPIVNPYYQWGLPEWDGVTNIPSNTKVRNYVFTYYDDAYKGISPSRDKVPNNADEENGIGGKSKVQSYIGSDETKDDKGNIKKYSSFDELPDNMKDDSGKDNWKEVSTLDEGTYNIYVYATSMGGTRIANPYTLTITIDRTKPLIDLNEITGRAGEISDDLADPEYAVLVNGVIQPSFAISDSRAGSTPYFEQPAAPGTPAEDKTYYPERMFILVKETGNVINGNTVINRNNMPVKDKLDEYFKLGKHYDMKKQIWPEFNAAGDAPVQTINGVPVVKHGLIVYSACRFKTSKIYHIPDAPTETDAIADGIYWVYAFVRDTAFNVGSVSFPIEVKASSDYPTFDWVGNSINPNVIKPDSAFDYPKDEDGLSFITKKGINNKLEPGASILVNITDDDSLD